MFILLYSISQSRKINSCELFFENYNPNLINNIIITYDYQEKFAQIFLDTAYFEIQIQII